MSGKPPGEFLATLTLTVDSGCTQAMADLVLSQYEVPNGNPLLSISGDTTQEDLEMELDPSGPACDCRLEQARTLKYIYYLTGVSGTCTFTASVTVSKYSKDSENNLSDSVSDHECTEADQKNA